MLIWVHVVSLAGKRGRLEQNICSATFLVRYRKDFFEILVTALFLDLGNTQKLILASQNQFK